MPVALRAVAMPRRRWQCARSSRPSWLRLAATRRAHLHARRGKTSASAYELERSNCREPCGLWKPRARGLIYLTAQPSDLRSGGLIGGQGDDGGCERRGSDPHRQECRRQERQTRGSHAEARQPARPHHRRHRHRQDRDAAGAGRGLLQRRRAGVRRRHQGRPLRRRRRRATRKDAFVKRAEEIGIDYEPDRVPGGVLGPVRRAGPSGPRHRLRDGAAAARRACSTSTTRRRACSTSPSGSPTSRVCCCST